MSKIQAGIPVTGSEFIGREEDINTMIELLQMGQSIVLIAPRRFGKTSLVLELLSHLKKQKKYTSFVDIFASPTIAALSEQITAQVLKNNKLDAIFKKSAQSALKLFKNAKLKAVIEDFEFLLSFAESNQNHWKLLENSIDFIDDYAIKNKKQMICAFDEFGDISKLNGNKIVKLFRSKTQQHKNTSYIFSGSYESVMNNLFVTQKAPFYRFARVINLGFIEPIKFSAYFKKKFKYFGITKYEKLSEQILQFTQGHPYYSQLALQETIIFYKLYDKLPTFNQLIETMLQSERNYLEKSWEEVSASKSTVKVIITIVKSSNGVYAALRNSGINIFRTLDQLKNRGVLIKGDNNSYQFSDPLFKKWIKTNVLS